MGPSETSPRIGMKNPSKPLAKRKRNGRKRVPECQTMPPSTWKPLFHDSRYGLPERTFHFTRITEGERKGNGREMKMSASRSPLNEQRHIKTTLKLDLKYFRAPPSLVDSLTLPVEELLLEQSSLGHHVADHWKNHHNE